MAAGIQQLIATQAQRSQGATPMELMSGVQQLDRGRLDNQIAQEKLSGYRSQMASNKRHEGLKFAGNVGGQIREMSDPAKKAQVYATARKMAEMNGHDVSAYPTEFNPQAEQMLEIAYQQVYQPELALKSFGRYGFGGQVELKDEKGNLFLSTMKKDPRTGMVEAVVAPVGGGAQQPVGRLQMVSSAGMTPDEKVRQVGDIEATKQDVRSKTEPQIQREITLAREKATKEVEKIVSQQGQKNKLADADDIYKDLSTANLDKIYGRGESVYKFLTAGQGYDQDSIDMMAQRDQLLGMLKLGARGELKGQGPITEGEQSILGDAVTTLGNPDISPDMARRALDSAMEILYRNSGKEFEGSQATKAAGKYKIGEIITTPGGKRYRVIGGDMNDPNVELVE